MLLLKYFLVVSVFILVSCNKHNTCSCTTTKGGISETNTTVYKYLTKKQVEATCLKNTTQLTGTLTITEYCVLN